MACENPRNIIDSRYLFTCRAIDKIVYTMQGLVEMKTSLNFKYFITPLSVNTYLQRFGSVGNLKN